ncbi:hypothetical protein H6P81_020358 [Aristolochia fimbriata]|uniref:Bromodomain associated domain-containing protein n=1 Tax=Aristolochia fimbriata TaxID=158543 RepID=A0AAV7DYN6_ARIFI|nr:hypothetical protein H6P81_020358 [Aristolochia fimbriata]
MALLGDDGRGFELARKLEQCGVWRSWLGDSAYPAFVPFLSSPALWESFMRVDESKSRAQVRLQLRARALIYDKATVSLFLRSDTSSAAVPSNINPAYLQLHADDIYFPLNGDLNDGIQHHQNPNQPSLLHSKTQSRAPFSPPRLNEHSFDRASNVGSRYSEPELRETWYDQSIEKYRNNKQFVFPSRDQESLKRTPEGMSQYLRHCERHKRSRQAFKEDLGFNKAVLENGSHMTANVVCGVSSSEEEEICFFPEVMFPSNCVPDSAPGPAKRHENYQKTEFYGVLDNLPLMTSRSAAMIERFGIKPEYLRMDVGRSKCRGKNGLEGKQKSLCQDQATQMSRKIIARVLTSVGLEGATEASMEVLSQFLCCHIGKLGRTLKVLSDNYRKQCSAIELLKMFLQTVGYGNFGALAEQLKDGTRVVSLQTPQQIRGLQAQHQNPLMQAQIQRQMHMLHPQNLAFQQQWDKLRKRQPSTPRGSTVLNSERDRPMMEVKIENPSEIPMDTSTLASINRQQLQFRQQQLAMANHQAQSSHQFKQLASLQVPQMQQQGMFNARPQPVKVEGFQELMGGDTSSKHDSDDHNRLTSPS